MPDNEPQSQWETHSHDAVVHSHRHYHVTHNHNQMTGGFDHLMSEHEHRHDHAEVTHNHWPHKDFENEHLGEAHIHDHDKPVDRQGGAEAKPNLTMKKAGAKKATAKKAAKAAGANKA